MSASAAVGRTRDQKNSSNGAKKPFFPPFYLLIKWHYFIKRNPWFMNKPFKIDQIYRDYLRNVFFTMQYFNMYVFRNQGFIFLRIRMPLNDMFYCWTVSLKFSHCVQEQGRQVVLLLVLWPLKCFAKYICKTHNGVKSFLKKHYFWLHHSGAWM